MSRIKIVLNVWDACGRTYLPKFFLLFRCRIPPKNSRPSGVSCHLNWMIDPLGLNPAIWLPMMLLFVCKYEQFTNFWNKFWRPSWVGMSKCLPNADWNIAGSDSFYCFQSSLAMRRNRRKFEQISSRTTANIRDNNHERIDSVMTRKADRILIMASRYGNVAHHVTCFRLAPKFWSVFVISSCR